MSTVQKYTIGAPAGGLKYSSVAMPFGAEVFAVTRDGPDIFVSAVVDAGNPSQTRQFLMVAEGEPFEEGWGGFLGIVKIGSTLFHVFDTW